MDVGAGGSPFRAFLYGVATIFGLTVLYNVVWEAAIMTRVEPILRGMISGESIGLPINATTAAVINSGFDNAIFMVRITPVVLIFGVIVFMIISAIRKQTTVELL